MGIDNELVGKRYSYNRFMGDVTAMLISAEVAININPEIGLKYKSLSNRLREANEQAYTGLQRIEHFYLRTPLDVLQDEEKLFREEFSHLSKAQDTLPPLREALDLVFQKRSRGAFEDLKANVEALMGYVNIEL